ncbi:unnamed protein product [Linum trigynum]|uniref:Uncharacterized protein n=1 Tax=Linum trigynum TaxID=586398 RepID=A0AAV2DZ02_9ROSI
MRREMEEDRKMAEVLREERVHEKGIEEHWDIGLGGNEEEKGNNGEAPPTPLAVMGAFQVVAEDLPGKCKKLIIGGEKWWWDDVGRG